MKLCIEIRPGEGGRDAKDLCQEQSRIYLRYAERHNLKVDIESVGTGS